MDNYVPGTYNDTDQNPQQTFYLLSRGLRLPYRQEHLLCFVSGCFSQVKISVANSWMVPILFERQTLIEFLVTFYCVVILSLFRLVLLG